MNTNDQWFEPGDKVMRVRDSSAPEGNPHTPFGKVFCVEKCWALHGHNVMTLVGIDPSPYKRYSTEKFRKVEEIRLCVDALKHSKTQEIQTH